MSSTPSRRKARAHTAAARAAAEDAVSLPSEVEVLVTEFVPEVAPATWRTIREVWLAVMYSAQLSSASAMLKHRGVIAHYLAYRHDAGRSIAVVDAFTADEINHYYLHGLTSKTTKTANDYRSRLLAVARKVNPPSDLAAPSPSLGARRVRPGYSDIEMAAIKRAARRQRSAVLSRQLSAIVGLCAGAGLRPQDLRQLRARHVIDHGDDGIEIQVPGPDARVVWVRIDFEDLVRAGVSGLEPAKLVLGVKPDRGNVTSPIIESAELYDVEHLDASRLRSTWLTWLMSRPVPIKVIMDASALKGARTLTELAADIAVVDPDPAATMRGEAS